MSKYLEFVLVRKTKPKIKTKIIVIYSKLHEDKLGVIKWFSRWRQYAFFPEFETVFNKDCLHDIEEYIRGLR